MCNTPRQLKTYVGATRAIVQGLCAWKLWFRSSNSCIGAVHRAQPPAPSQRRLVSPVCGSTAPSGHSLTSRGWAAGRPWRGLQGRAAEGRERQKGSCQQRGKQAEEGDWVAVLPPSESAARQRAAGRAAAVSAQHGRAAAVSAQQLSAARQRAARQSRRSVGATRQSAAQRSAEWLTVDAPPLAVKVGAVAGTVKGLLCSAAGQSRGGQAGRQLGRDNRVGDSG